MSTSGSVALSWFQEVLEPLNSNRCRTREVLASRLDSQRHASGVMKVLSDNLPLEMFDLVHLKRIRKDETGTPLQLMGHYISSIFLKSWIISGLTVLLAPCDMWRFIDEQTRQVWTNDFQLSAPMTVTVPAKPAACRSEVRLICGV
jgi:hypothetical protein